MSRTKSFNEMVVLQKAMELFWKKGYTLTPPSDLVSTLGISRSSLYSTYGDKRELLLKTLNHYIITQGTDLINLFDKADDILEVLGVLFDEIICINNDGMNKYGCFAINTAMELIDCGEDIKELLENNNKRILKALSELVERNYKNGRLTNEIPPKELAEYIYNNMIGLRVQVRMGKSAEELNSIKKIILKTLK